MTASRLYRGSVVHRRLRPLRHRLRYRVDTWLVDLDELPALDRRLRLFSLDRFNLYSLHQRDHGDGTPGGLRAHLERRLAEAGCAPGGAIRLLAMPRLLGHVFNPLSVYFCHAPGDGRLQAIVYEVNNTFGRRHDYVIPVAPGAAGADGLVVQRCAKAMHVSPFLGLDLEYRFRVRPPTPSVEGEAGRLSIAIDVHDADGAVLVAGLDARPMPLTDAALLRSCLTRPFVTLKVVAAIHWEALKLWAKGATFHPQPPGPRRAASIVLPIDTP